MKRITRPGGWVIALAEPDYGGRIDYPSELESLGKEQTLRLYDQGADVVMGRKLKSLFSDIKLENIHSGIISAEWNKQFNTTEFNLEWSVLKRDLQGKMPQKELVRYYGVDLAASGNGTRVLFVPIFYAFGQVPA